MAKHSQPKQQRGGLISAIAEFGRMLSIGLAGLAEHSAPGWACEPAGPLGEDLSSRRPAYEQPAPAAPPSPRASQAGALAPSQASHTIAS